MLLSVIIPAYNSEETILQAIKSASVNANNQIEVIIINNGSQDRTKEIVKNKAQNNKNIVYAESAKGVSNARNKGLELATGKWITFLDADDTLVDFEKAKLTDLLLSDQADLIIGNYLSGNTKIDLYSLTQNKNNNTDVIKQMLENPTKYMTVWGKFYRTKLIRDKKIKFDTDLSYSEDSEFLIRYLLVCRRPIFISNFVYKYSLFENSTVRKYNPEVIQEYEKSIIKIKKDLKNYSVFDNSFSIFILMQFNLIMVHNVFMGKSSNQLLKLKEFCQKDYIERALSIIKLKDVFTVRLLPLVLCKYHIYKCAAIIYRLRVIQNNRNMNRM